MTTHAPDVSSDYGRSPARWAAGSLSGNADELFAALEAGLPVKLIATFGGLVTCRVDEKIEDALKRAQDGNFDYLPVTEKGLIVGLLHCRARQILDCCPVR